MAGFSASWSIGGGGGGGSSQQAPPPNQAVQNAASQVAASCASAVPGSAAWGACQGSTYLNVPQPVNLGPNYGVVPLPKPGTHPSIKLGPLATTLAKPVAQIKLPSYVLKPRTPAEQATGGRTLDLTPRTIVVALILVGAIGYVMFSNTTKASATTKRRG